VGTGRRRIAVLGADAASDLAERIPPPGGAALFHRIIYAYLETFTAPRIYVNLLIENAK
jgi:hypothetical protein